MRKNTPKLHHLQQFAHQMNYKTHHKGGRFSVSDWENQGVVICTKATKEVVWAWRVYKEFQQFMNY